jgi:hypothetical protein
MSDHEQAPQVEALQAVVDRVVSWQDGAPESTVREELAKGVREAGVEVPAPVLDELARRIHDDADHVEAARVVEAHAGEVEPG